MGTPNKYMNKRFSLLTLAAILSGSLIALALVYQLEGQLNYRRTTAELPLTSPASSTPAVPLYKPVIDYEQAVIGAVEKFHPPWFLLLFPRICRLLSSVLPTPSLICLRNFSNFLATNFNFLNLAKKELKIKKLAAAADLLSPKTG